MANTKSTTDRAARKSIKRELRKGLKETFRQLSPADKTRFRKSETVGLRKWIEESKKD